MLDGILREVHLARAGATLWMAHGSTTHIITPYTPRSAGSAAGSGTVTAPGAGTVIAVPVSVGDVVAIDDALVVLEAMKLETTLRATVAGTVCEIRTRTGQQVKTRQVLIIIEESET